MSKLDNLGEINKALNGQLEQLSCEKAKLELNEAVRRYIELCEKQRGLLGSLDLNVQQMQLESMKECSHIFVTTKSVPYYSVFESGYITEHFCIKCSLNNTDSALEAIWKEASCRGIDTKLMCEANLARSITMRIRGENPDIDDEKLAQKFANYLYSIKAIKDDSFTRKRMLLTGTSKKA